jgi:hypothetical protein
MLIELIRKQIKTCGKKHAEICRDTGVEQAVIFRIMKGGSCKAETVETLLKYFGFEVVKKHKQERGKK